MKNIFILFTIWIIILSCERKKESLMEGAEYTFKMNPKVEMKKKPMSELYDIFKYVPLETTEESVIGNISKMVLLEKSILIHDETTNSIFSFDRSGKFNFKISKTGKGPGEYVAIDGFSCDRNHIYLLDSALGKVLVFSRDGSFVREMHKKIYAGSFETEAGEFMFYSNFIQNDKLKNKYKSSNLLITDGKLKLKMGALPFDAETNPSNIIGHRRNIQKHNNGIIVWQHFDYNIYSYKTDKLTIRYKFEFSGKDKEICYKVQQYTTDNAWNYEGYNKLVNNLGYCDIIELLDTRTCLSLIYKHKEYYHYAYVFKDKKRIIDLAAKMEGNNPPIALINDIDGVLHYPLMSSQGDTIFSFCSSYELLDNRLGKKRAAELGVTYSSNPVIVMLKIKI